MELSERIPRRYQHGNNDVFCLVRHHLCDVELQQPALLILPGDEKPQFNRFWHDAHAHQGELTHVDPERAAELLEIAQVLNKYPQYERAVRYYESLADKIPRPRIPVHKFPFIAAGGNAQPAALDAQLPERNPRPAPHELRVRFHYKRR